MILIATDFGHGGSYAGEICAVLARMAPTVPHVTLISDLPRFEPRLSAYLLAPLVARSEPGDVILAVVDPGVGSDRAAIALEVDGRWLVGPDNGLFEPCLRRATDMRSFAITWRPPALSASFHGRDLFAPMAARLARGDRSGIEPCEPSRFPDWPDDLDAIVHIDSYGNLITGIRAVMLPENATISLAGRSLPWARTFSDRPAGELLAYENSSGLVEIAANRSSAAVITGAHLSDAVTIR